MIGSVAITRKRRVFIEEYLKCWNATKAAEAAGYKFPTRQGSRLLTFVEVKEEIQRRLDEKVMSADEALARLSDQARLDVGLFVYEDDDHELHVNWGDLVEAELTHLVKAIYLTKYGTRIEFHDPQRALELIGKHHRLFSDTIEHTGEITLNYAGNVDPDEL